MPATAVQDWVATTTGTTASPTSASVSLGVTATANNVLLVAVNSDATVNTPAGYTSLVSSIHNAGCYLFGKVAAGSETGVTVTPTVAASTCVGIAEIGGLLAAVIASIIDKTASGGSAATTTTRSTGTTAGTVQADEYAVAVWGYTDGNVAFPSGGSNKWSGQTNSFVEKIDVGTTKASGTNVGLCIAVKDLGSTGTVESTASTSPATTAGESLVATFKVAAAGPSFIAPLPYVVAQAVNRSYTY